MNGVKSLKKDFIGLFKNLEECDVQEGIKLSTVTPGAQRQVGVVYRETDLEGVSNRAVQKLPGMFRVPSPWVCYQKYRQVSFWQ